MSVKNIERFHGSVLTRIVRSSRDYVSIKFVDSDDACSYEMSGRAGLYIKYSSKRMRPWQFSFTRSNQQEIASLKGRFGEVFIAFVCNTNGIVFLTHDELKQILDDEHGEVEWVRISRKPRGMYEINGSDGKMKCRVGESSSMKGLLAFCELRSNEEVLAET